MLSAIEQGDPQAAEQLFLFVYNELRKIAAAKLALENPGQTLQPTALVHEVYLRLIHQSGGRIGDSRAYFFAAAGDGQKVGGMS